MFPERLKSLRKNAGLSQDSFAKDLSVGQSTIAGWENGKREPNIEMFCRIADYFGVTLDYLFGRVDQPTGHLIQNEKLPTELVDSRAVKVVKLGSPELTGQEIESLRRLLAERPDL